MLTRRGTSCGTFTAVSRRTRNRYPRPARFGRPRDSGAQSPCHRPADRPHSVSGAVRSVRNDSRFRPLDAEERLPRELLIDNEPIWFGDELRRYRLLGQRHTPKFLWAPALVLALALVVWAGGAPLPAAAAFGMVF